MREKKFHIGVKALIVNNGKVLILKEIDIRDNVTKLYNLPGGRIDADENIEEAMARELKEELGITKFKIGSLLYVFERKDYVKDGASLMLICYEVKADASKIALSDEHISYHWIGKKDLEKIIKNKEKMNKGTKMVLEMVLK